MDWQLNLCSERLRMDTKNELHKLDPKPNDLITSKSMVVIITILRTELVGVA